MSNVVRTYSEYRDHTLHQVVAYKRLKTMGKSKTVSPKSGDGRFREVPNIVIRLGKFWS